MKLPEIYGANKIRDAKILQFFLDGETETDIAIMFGISQSRVAQIVYRNRALLNADKTLEKAKRINLLKKQIKKAGDSKKDVADLIDQLRVEVEGNKLEHSGLPKTQINLYPSERVIFTDADDAGIEGTQNLYDGKSASGSRIESAV